MKLMTRKATAFAASSIATPATDAVDQGEVFNIATFKVKSGQEPAFEQVMKQVVIDSRAEPGILGFIVVFAISLWLALGTTPEIAKALPAAAGEANVFRVIFFILTFLSIGVLSDFRKLWQQGFAKLAAVYFVSLFGFVIWVGLLISWLFFSGVKPPLAS
jgi:hypothetical protein